MTRALVLSGGGSKGAWQAGVVYSLVKRHGRTYDNLYGISVGALNAAFLSQYNGFEENTAVEDLVKMWKTITNKHVRKHWFPFSFLHGLWKNSFYNTKPLRKLLEKHFSSACVVRRCFVGAVSLNTKQVRYFDVGTGRSWGINAILASSAFPGFLTAQRIERDVYVDGGVRDITPLKLAIDHGADEIDVVICSNPFAEPVGKGKMKFSAFEVLINSIDAMSAEIMLNDVKIAEMYNELLSAKDVEGKRKVKINLYYPEKALGYSTLDFNNKNILEMIEKGKEFV